MIFYLVVSYRTCKFSCIYIIHTSRETGTVKVSYLKIIKHNTVTDTQEVEHIKKIRITVFMIFFVENMMPLNLSL